MPEVLMLVASKVSEYLYYHQVILADGCREKKHAQGDLLLAFSASKNVKIGL